MLHRILPRFTEPSYALLRIVSGLLFAFHGAQKLLGLFAGPAAKPLDLQKQVGGFIELVGGLLIMIGLGTRWAAFIASGTMAVAYTQFHWKGQLDEGFFPIVNKGELALVYAFVFLFIACRGAGIWSVDGRLPSNPQPERSPSEA